MNITSTKKQIKTTTHRKYHKKHIKANEPKIFEKKIQ